MSFEISGKLIAIFPTQVRANNFRTREFVVEKVDQGNGREFSNFIKFQCVQDKTEILDRFKEGDVVNVKFNIKGTKWEKEGRTSYITNLDAWRIESNLGGNTAAPQMPPPPADGGFIDPPFSDASDLPF